jgi:phage tail-like protein
VDDAMTTYPAPGFQFTIKVLGSGASLQSASAADGGFQEVTGLEAQREVETIQAGGANGGVLQLPKGIKFPNLVLRRGYITAASFLSEWAARTVGSDLSQPILTQGLLIELLGADQSPVVAWNVQSAWPVRWQTGPLDAMKNEVLTEVLEFAYASITRIPMGDATNMVTLVDALIS